MHERLSGAQDWMGVATLGLLTRVEADLHSHGWDQRPRLWISYRTLADPEVLAGSGLREAMALELHEIGDGLFDEIDGGEIARRLHLVARVTPPGLVPENVFAWVFSCEGWMATALPGEMEQLERYAAEHPIAEHPDRVEIRQLCAVDRAGVGFHLHRRRDTDEVYVTRDALGGACLEGRIMDGLRALMEATL